MIFMYVHTTKGPEIVFRLVPDIFPDIFHQLHLVS